MIHVISMCKRSRKVKCTQLSEKTPTAATARTETTRGPTYSMAGTTGATAWQKGFICRCHYLCCLELIRLHNLQQTTLSLVPRPKQPQHRSLAVFRAGKEGLGIWAGGTRINAWNAGILNYWLIITFYRKYFFAVLEVRLEVCMLTPTK